MPSHHTTQHVSQHSENEDLSFRESVHSVKSQVDPKTLPTISLGDYIMKHNLTQIAAGAIDSAAFIRSDYPIATMVKHFDGCTYSKILKVTGRQIFDSRGFPTVEVDIQTNKGIFTASCPSGTTAGSYEACDLRDGDVFEFHGKGVSRAVASVNEIIGPALLGRDPRQQRELDDLMRWQLDGTGNLSKLGANAVLPVSVALCKAGAAENLVPLYEHIGILAGNKKFVLPVPAFGVLSGGLHATNLLPMQELMVMPIGAKTFTEAMRMGTEVYHHLKTLIKEVYGKDACNVGDMGGFAPFVPDTTAALDLTVDAIERAGYTGKVRIALDAAASEFYMPDSKYCLQFKEEGERKPRLTGRELREVYVQLCSRYPIVSIEDPFDQDDFESTAGFTKLDMCQVIGDDLLVTNPVRVDAAIKGKVCNALLLKINQVGTVSDGIEAVRISKQAGWGVMASHRSGETEDSFIADLAVGLACGQIKSGAPCRSERLAKYNQLLRIEQELGKKAVYAGEALYRHIPWEER